MARQLRVEIVGDSRGFSRALQDATGHTSRFGSSLARLGKIAVLSAGAAGVGAVAIGLRQGIKEYIETSKVAAQTNAVIKSTGGVANVSAKEVDKLAESLMRKSGVDDEAIKSGENMLLTFTKVRNEVGAGNDVFNQATLASTNLSVALGKDLPSSAMLVGKALNDPVKGMTAMTRAGIQFTDQQKNMIKSLVESGDMLGAQKIILKELETQFGGSAKAAGQTLPGQLRILREEFNNFAGSIIAKAAPALQQFVGFLNERLIPAQGFTAKLKVVWEGVSEVASELGVKLSAAIAGVDWASVGASIGRAIKGAIDDAGPGVTAAANELVEKINSGIRGGNWDAIGETMGTKLRQQIRTSLESSGAESKSLSDKLVDGIRDSLSKVPGLGVVMRVPSSTLAASFGAALQTAKGFFSGLTGITTESMSNFVSKIRQGMSNAVSAVAAAAGGVFSAAQRIGSQIISGVLSGLGGLYGAVKGKIDSMLGAALNAIDIRGGSPPQHAAQKLIGEPLGQGVIDGWIKSTATLPEKMSATLKAAIEKARATIETARDRLGSAFDGLTSRILRAFDAESTGFETTHEKILREIDDRRQMEDLVQRQADAQIRLNEAIKEGDAAAIAAAQRDLTRATEDIARVDIEAKAAAERKNLDSLREEQRIHLEKKLAALEASFVKEGASVKKAMAAMAKLMASFGIDFESAGALVGEAFVAGLKNALGVAAAAAAGVGRAVPGPSSFSPGVAAAGAGGSTVVLNNYAPINSERQLEDMIVAATARVRGRGGLA